MMYDIIYSDRKTLALQIKDGKLIVRAPRRTPKQKIEKAVKDHIGWIEKHMAMAGNHPDPSVEEEKKLRKLAREILPVKTSYYAEIMGVKYGRITITGAKTRYGSCSSKGNIAFSFRLMAYPEEAVDYVVVHELAHLKEMNHSKNFYAIVAKILPDYKARAKLLKK